MAELEADNDERPLEPPFIKKTEILNNPFDDIYPRELKRKPGKTTFSNSCYGNRIGMEVRELIS